MKEIIQKTFKSTITDIVDKIQQVQLEMFENANKSVLELLPTEEELNLHVDINE